MKALLLCSPGKLEVRNVQDPVPGPGGAVIRIRSALTCGTSLKAYLRGHPKIKMPGPFGHEFSGVIDSIGSEVKGFKEGDRVVCLHTYPCFECSFCRRGKTNLCRKFDENLNLGAFAEKIGIPSSLLSVYCFKLPENVSFQRAAFLQSLSCVFHGFHILFNPEIVYGRINQRQKEKENFFSPSVCIIGTGSFALLFAMVLKHFRIPVIILGRSMHKKEWLEQLGFSCEISEDAVKSRLEGNPDVVVECVGVPETWEKSVSLVNHGGKILFFGGLPKDANICLNHHKIHYSEVQIFGSFHYTPYDVEKAKECLFDSLDPSFMISGSLKLEEASKAFENMQRGKGFKYEILP